MNKQLRKLKKTSLINIYSYTATISGKYKLIIQNLIGFRIENSEGQEVYLDELPKLQTKRIIKLAGMLDSHQDDYGRIPLFVCDCGVWLTGETPIFCFKKPTWAKNYTTKGKKK